MKFGSLVSLRATASVLGFSGAKLSKVFGSFWDYILEELKCDAAEGFACVRVRVSGVARYEIGVVRGNCEVLSTSFDIANSGASRLNRLGRQHFPQQHFDLPPRVMSKKTLIQSQLALHNSK